MKMKFILIMIFFILSSCFSKRPIVFYNEEEQKITAKDSNSSIIKIEIFRRENYHLLKTIKVIETSKANGEIYLNNIDTTKYFVFESDTTYDSSLQFNVSLIINGDTQNVYYFTFSNDLKVGEKVKEIKSTKLLP